MNKKLTAVILCLALMLTTFVSPEQVMAKKAKIKLNKKKVSLYVGKSVRLKVKGTKKKVKWKSNKKKVATVSSKGKVKAKKKGTARITAKVGKKKLVCVVTVKNKKSVGSADEGNPSLPDAGATADPTGNGGQNLPTAPSQSAGAGQPQASSGASGTVKPQESAGADATADPHSTAGTDETPGPQTTDGTGGTAKPQTTSGASGTVKPQTTPGASGTVKPQATSGASGTVKPQATSGAGGTGKPQTTSSASGTKKPQTTSSAGGTAKPQTTAGTGGTMKPQTTSGASGTKEPQTTSGAGGTLKPQTTAGASGTAAPQSSSDVDQTANPSEQPMIPALSKKASFESGTDGYVARGNASIQVVDGGYDGKCLQVSNRTSASDGVGYAAGDEVTAGESYTVWGYVKLESGSGTVKCMYQTGDGSTHELTAVEASDGWVKIMGSITVPSVYTKLDIWFEASDETAVFCIDEIRISEITSIKNTYRSLFGEVGTCINLNQLEDPDTLAYVKKHYTSITMENDMKPDPILVNWAPTFISTETAKTRTGDYIIPDSYQESQVPQLNFSSVDKELKLAKKNGLKIRFHVLVWHSQTPEWFFKENYSRTDGAAYVSEETMYARMEMYIRSVMHHVYSLDGGAYKDVVYVWDVANEYLHNDKDKNWSAVFGNREGKLESRPPYIKKAFEIAYEMLEEFSLQDSVSLFYNDFNTYYDVTDKIVDMINYINSEKRICSGIGMQSHLGVTWPSVDSYINTVKRFINEGFEVQITELDLGCMNKKDRPDETKEEAYENQAKYVSEMMRKLIALQEESSAITGLTWWGLYDATSWRRNPDSESGDEHALMFDTHMNDAKPAYFAFMEAAGPIVKPVPTPTPEPTPAPPSLDYDFTDEDSYNNESPDGASSVVNADGSFTITFKNQYAAFNFYLPEWAKHCKGYEAVELTYTSEGGDLGHALYDTKLEEDKEGSKHPDWGKQIKESPSGDKRITFNATAECVGGCIRGFQIFNPNVLENGATITITVKSLKFVGMVSNEPQVPDADDLDVPAGYRNVNEAVAGTVEDITYDSTAIKEGATVQRKAKVVLPKGYTKGKKYPVVYMQHGIFGDETSLYGDKTQNVIWNAIASGAAEEMIVVFPNACANEAGKGDGFNLEHYAAYDNFINDLEKCLMPYINEHYSTLTGRENTAICGFSMGGRVSLQIGFLRQEKFGYIGGFCPTFGIFEYENYGVHEDGFFTSETFTLKPEYMDNTLVLFAAGSSDDIVRTEPKRYSDALTANGVPHIYYETAGGHDATVYHHGLYNFLRRVFKEVKTDVPTPKPIPSVPPVSAVTAPPTYTVDFDADRKLENGNNAAQSVQDDASATVTFGNYEGLHYLLPDTEEMNAARYKYVTITYSGTGSELSVYLYGDDTDLSAESIADQGNCKHEASVKLPMSDTETAVTYSVGDAFENGYDFSKGSFRGIQFFRWAPGDSAGNSLNIKSIVFSEREPGAKPLELSKFSGGEKTDAGVVLSDIEQVTVPLPASAAKGTKVKVTVRGTLSADSTGFRIWLAEEAATASDQYYYTKNNGVGFGGKGDGSLSYQTGEFTVTSVLTVGGEGSNNSGDAANNLLIKAPASGLKMSGVTISDIEVRSVEE